MTWKGLMEEKGYGLGAEGQIGLHRKSQVKRTFQAGSSDTSSVSATSFISSPLGQTCSWRRMDNTKVWTLAQKFVSLIGLAVEKLSSH